MVASLAAPAGRRSRGARRSLLALTPAVIGAVALLAGPSAAGAAPPVDADYGGVSSDGSRVFFVTNEQLVSADRDSKDDVYERSGGSTKLISQGNINGNGNLSAGYAGSSADGSRVLFISFEQLVGADSDSSLDIYERAGDTTTLVSQGEINGNGPFNANRIGASVDAGRVVFETKEQLVAADTDEVRDLYQRAGGVTTRMTQGEINGNEPLEFLLVGASSDGSRVFFDTKERLLPADVDNAVDTYERSDGVTKLVSQGDINGNAEENASFAGSSSDGTIVFFDTSESLVAADTDPARDLYQRSGGTTTLVSQGQINGNGNSNADAAGFSADGSLALFVSFEQLAPEDTDTARDIYARAGGTTTLVSESEGPDAKANVDFAGASDDAKRVFYLTEESQVGADVDGGFRDVYERAGGFTTLVSAGTVNGNSPLNAEFVGASSDGSIVFFLTREALTADDADNFADVYQRAGGLTTLVSRGEINGNGTFGVTYTGSSADGSRVFFTTDERLTADDVDGARDLYERSGGTTKLVSTGNGGKCGSKRVPKIKGTDLGEVLTGTAAVDRINGAGGRDRVLGRGGGDCLRGGAGRDTLKGQGGGDDARGGAGADKIVGGGGADRLKGQGGGDRIRGGASRDRIAGGPGDDTLSGGGGRDRLNGNAGADRIMAADGKADKVNCGSGNDLAVVDAEDRVGRSCETVRRRR